MLTVEGAGADRFAQVSKRLKDAGAKGMQRELDRAINRATVPLRLAAKRSAAETLPRRGGLGARVAKTRMTTRRRRAGRGAGVRIVANPGTVKDPLRIDRGRVRHPVYGRGPWVLQDVKPGWFTTPMEAGAPAVRKELIAAMNAVARQLGR